MTIRRGIIPGGNTGQYHAHTFKCIKRGVPFIWRTVNPDVPFLSSIAYCLRRDRVLLWFCTENPHRRISSPSSSDNVNRRASSESTSRSANSTPTVVNKRKYVASNTSGSSSSASSSAPSSPSSDVDREAGDPQERLVFRLPHRGQAAKRPRLDFASSGGLLVAAQQILSPPVFRRRPPTPFSCPPGETSVATGDQAEDLEYAEGNGNDEVEADGSSPAASYDVPSDDSLNLPLWGRR